MASALLILHMLVLHITYGQDLENGGNFTTSESKTEVADLQSVNVAGDDQVFEGNLPDLNSTQPTGIEKSSQPKCACNMTNVGKGLATKGTRKSQHKETDVEENRLYEFCRLFYSIFITVIEGVAVVLLLLILLCSIVSIVEICTGSDQPLSFKSIFHRNSAPRMPDVTELRTVATDTVD